MGWGAHMAAQLLILHPTPPPSRLDRSRRTICNRRYHSIQTEASGQSGHMPHRICGLVHVNDGDAVSPPPDSSQTGTLPTARHVTSAARHSLGAKHTPESLTDHLPIRYPEVEVLTFPGPNGLADNSERMFLTPV